ncbi:longitudinals lacking protein, isoforms A/B/D/L-like [Bombus vosnesenskii]|uniref:Longitudinals lacking protein, isoforms A/B/D/L-like n=3 Tax=Pyrobombus TaxID=144703 RepID=A0A6J3KZV6_9HYME|nr:longitudinals lacking protein, isoforms A/B/D/L-like [Bombus impatiens]XP_033196320.1 longitudinals lacking protein, isoforms A/B/D/L-like [Bombus vancouverensis nearcticus]XP_033304275.1 longitudinals lacking protein, isoforms A/B/D/L-like [Bombus bifarius]XP_033358893.1 longitudinals lacking protein, isoforms A/B/D/L-like [Bombus vosnesenskii]
MRSNDSQFFCIVRQTERLFWMVDRAWQLLPVYTTGPFSVFGINVGIEDDQGQSIGKLWSRSSNQTDLDNNFKTKRFPCPNCTCAYSQKYSLNRHLTYECGQEPRFKCPHCEYRCKKSANIYEHVRRRHKNCQVYAIDVLKIARKEET